MYNQLLFNIPIFNMYFTMFFNLECILEANDSDFLTDSHIYILEMLSHLTSILKEGLKILKRVIMITFLSEPSLKVTFS